METKLSLRWLASQTKLKRCWRIRRAEGKYSSLRKPKPEPVFLTLLLPPLGAQRKDKPYGVDLRTCSLRRNSWPGCQYPNEDS